MSPYINMTLPWVYTCSTSWTLVPLPSPYCPSGSPQCTSPKHPVVIICSDFGALKNKVSHCFIFSPSLCHEVMGLDAIIFVFWMGSLSQMFHSPLSISWRGSLVPLNFLPWGWCHLHIWYYWYFSQKPWFQFVLHPIEHFSWCTLHLI